MEVAKRARIRSLATLWFLVILRHTIYLCFGGARTRLESLLVRNGASIFPLAEKKCLQAGRPTEAWREFHVDEQGHLVHTRALSKRRVVPQSQIVPLLTELYAQPSWKSGRDRFYKRIAEQYLGISRREVMIMGF